MRRGLGFHARHSPGLRFSPEVLFAGGVQGAWFDPSDSTTLFSDRAGTTPCAAPGAGALVPVGRMLDKSGNANHATAANDTTARPELSARVNLLTYTEQFDNAAWTKANVTVSANTTATTDPLGGTTADKLIENTSNNRHFTFQLPNVAAASYTYSIYAKAAERSWLAIDLTTGANFYCWFDLQNGVLGTVNASRTASITAVGNGWYRCTVTASSLSGLVYTATFISTADNVDSYTGDGTSGIYIWGADLRPTNIGSSIPAYQRVADQYTYDNNGFPRYLAFNGTSSAMSTPANVNLSGTDKATVFAGVRKNDNTNAQIIAETSANPAANNGSFYCVTNANSVGGSLSAAYAVQVRGTSTAGAGAAGTTAPISNVVDGLFNISAAADAAILRVNGAQVATSGATSAGTGNFGSYPLFIGARNNASLFLTGSIYSLIVAGTAVSAGNITATESWVNGKVGGVY